MWMCSKHCHLQIPAAIDCHVKLHAHLACEEMQHHETLNDRDIRPQELSCQLLLKVAMTHAAALKTFTAGRV